MAGTADSTFGGEAWRRAPRDENRCEENRRDDGGWGGAAESRSWRRPAAEEDDGDSVWSAWSRSVDHWTIGACLALFAIGVVLSFAASPALVHRQDAALPAFHYAWRHLLFGLPTFLTLFALSFVGPRTARRVASALLIVAVSALIVLPSLGVAHGKEATRWFSLFGVSFQPTEMLKPGLIVACAWMLSAVSHSDPRVARGAALAAFLTVAIAVGLLIRQPDYSQAALLLAVWGGMYFVAGGRFLVLAIVGAAGLIIASVAYHLEPHFAGRIDGFLDPEGAGHDQLRIAHEAVVNGGWFGRGLGEGVAKADLPDAHADFIMAVAAEEYGFTLAILIVALFAVIPLRAMWRVRDVEDPFHRIAGTGLALLIGLQAFVNVAVTAQLVPVTGVTLPFISYGGSSMVATGITVGLMLALTRRRPRDISRDLDRDF